MPGKAQVPAQIAAGVALSGVVLLQRGAIVAISVPANWTAAVITFLHSTDNNVDTFKSVFDKTGAEYSITVVAGNLVAIPSTDLTGLRYIQVRSGTKAAPVNQVNAVTLFIIMTD